VHSAKKLTSILNQCHPETCPSAGWGTFRRREPFHRWGTFAKTQEIYLL